MMASYLRNIFGGGQPTSTTPSSSSKSRQSTSSKSHHNSSSHSRSAASLPPSNVNYNYIYAAPGSTYPIYPTNHVSPSKHTSSRTNKPSPLRYNSYDAAAARTYAPSASTTQVPSRPPLYKSPTYSHPGEHPVHYPVFNPSMCSSRTNSSSSVLQTSSLSGHSTSSTGVSSSGRRPALKQTRTWSGSQQPSGSKPHVSFQNPNRAETLNMHPLLASSRFTHAPISYDVLSPPTTRSILDRNTRSAVPSHTLSQPATDPPTFGKLFLHSEKFPWAVVAQSPTKSASRFYIAGSVPKKAAPVTNLDVLNAVHQTLAVRVTQVEWDSLGSGSRAQRKATRAYEKRCTKMGGGWDGGVRRVDLLGEKTQMIGVQIDKTDSQGRVAKLLFGKA